MGNKKGRNYSNEYLRLAKIVRIVFCLWNQIMVVVIVNVMWA